MSAKNVGSIFIIIAFSLGMFCGWAIFSPVPKPLRGTMRPEDPWIAPTPCDSFADEGGWHWARCPDGSYKQWIWNPPDEDGTSHGGRWHDLPANAEVRTILKEPWDPQD